jgi:hypothetical protein
MRVMDGACNAARIGDQFMIRYTETNRVPIASSSHMDYLFGRMFSPALLTLKSSDRVA